MGFTWKDKANPDPVLRKLVEVRTTDGERLSLSGWGVHEYTATLAPMLRSPPALPRQTASAIVERAIYKALKHKNVSRSVLLAEANAQLSDYLATPSKPYTLVTTVNVRFATNRKVRIGGAVVTLSDSLPKKYLKARKEGLDHVKSWLTEQDPLAGFVLVQVKARQDVEAAEKALRQLDLLRGWWNFALNKSFVIRLGGRPKAVNRIKCGALQTLHDSDGSSEPKTGVRVRFLRGHDGALRTVPSFLFERFRP